MKLVGLIVIKVKVGILKLHYHLLQRISDPWWFKLIYLRWLRWLQILFSRVTNHILLRRLLLLFFRQWRRGWLSPSFLVMSLLLSIIASASTLTFVVTILVTLLVPLRYHCPSLLWCLPLKILWRWIIAFFVFFALLLLFGQRVASGSSFWSSLFGR